MITNSTYSPSLPEGNSSQTFSAIMPPVNPNVTGENLNVIANIRVLKGAPFTSLPSGFPVNLANPSIPGADGALSTRDILQNLDLNLFTIVKQTGPLYELFPGELLQLEAEPLGLSLPIQLPVPVISWGVDLTNTLPNILTSGLLANFIFPPSIKLWLLDEPEFINVTIQINITLPSTLSLPTDSLGLPTSSLTSTVTNVIPIQVPPDLQSTCVQFRILNANTDEQSNY